MPLTGLKHDKAGVRRAVYSFRRHIVAELGSRGVGSVGVASKVHTACVALRRHLAVEQKLREQADTLSLEQWQGLVDRSVRLKEAVDRALKDLGLGEARKPLDIWAVLDTLPAPTPVAPPTTADVAHSRDGLPEPTNASTGQLGPLPPGGQA
jgi:hypothetical protein